MSDRNEKRLSRDEVRALLLANANTLMSDKFRTAAAEISGERKVKSQQQKTA
ncbi:hypothetical protein [Pantoea cypripedii]|uniref:hypothetical protein n=1 Tax=Pantoea cypripedii TaxID=55209 RepID=UPI001ABF17C8|nr:hypothetical protein [Pantoea cypripedii]